MTKHLQNMQSLDLVKELLQVNHSNTSIEIKTEPWNADYEAFRCELNGQTYMSRRAHKTPKKRGYFFAMWCKADDNNNRPYQDAEFPMFLVVNVIDGQRFGQFVFPREVLVKQHIISTTSHKGKMALRVYSTWEEDLNPSAAKTQHWQDMYFTNLTIE